MAAEPCDSHIVVRALRLKSTPILRAMQATVVMALLMVAPGCSMDEQLMEASNVMEFGAAGGALYWAIGSKLRKWCRNPR